MGRVPSWVSWVCNISTWVSWVRAFVVSWVKIIFTWVRNKFTWLRNNFTWVQNIFTWVKFFYVSLRKTPRGSKFSLTFLRTGWASKASAVRNCVCVCRYIPGAFKRESFLGSVVYLLLANIGPGPCITPFTFICFTSVFYNFYFFSSVFFKFSQKSNVDMVVSVIWVVDIVVFERLNQYNNCNPRQFPYLH